MLLLSLSLVELVSDSSDAPISPLKGLNLLVAVEVQRPLKVAFELLLDMLLKFALLNSDLVPLEIRPIQNFQHMALSSFNLLHVLSHQNNMCLVLFVAFMIIRI